MKFVYKIFYIGLLFVFIVSFEAQIRFGLAWQHAHTSAILGRIVGLSIGLIEPLFIICLGFIVFKKSR